MNSLEKFFRELDPLIVGMSFLTGIINGMLLACWLSE